MMDPGGDDVPSSSPSTDGAATSPPQNQNQQQQQKSSSSRYEEQKRRDWKTFLRFLESRKPRLTPSRARSPHVIDFLKSIDHLGKTLVHDPHCPFFGRPDPPAPCSCPLRQSWGSLDALVGRLRAACDESPVRPDTNPFGVRAVRNYLLRIKDTQATARGIPYSKKRKPPPTDDDPHPDPLAAVEQSTAPPPHASSPNSLPTPAALPGPSPAVPPLGPFGQDVPGQMQICWVRPPFSDNQSAPPFLPIWTYPNMQSLVPFLPPFPYVPIPTPAMKSEKKARIPKQESESEEEDPTAGASGTMEGPSSSNEGSAGDGTQAATEQPWKQRNRYEEQKRRDWKTFLRFLENRQPRLTLSRVRSPHVIEFLKSLDQFGKTLVHDPGCQFFGHFAAAAPCICPLRQSWGSLDALVGRLRAACEESSNCPEANPFGVRAVRNYLLQVKDSQATARGIPYSRKRKQRNPICDEPDQTPSQSLVVANACLTTREGSDAPECASSNYEATPIGFAAASAAISVPRILSADSLADDYFPSY